jgi:hypothetical protein
MKTFISIFTPAVEPEPVAPRGSREPVVEEPAPAPGGRTSSKK